MVEPGNSQVLGFKATTNTPILRVTRLTKNWMISSGPAASRIGYQPARFPGGHRSGFDFVC